MSSVETQCCSPSDDETDTRIHVQLWTIAGDLVGNAALDVDATIGQFRTRLNKPLQWYKQYKQFVIATTTFNFDDDYMRFTQTKVVKEHIWRDETGLRTLRAVVIGQDDRK